MDQLSHDKLGTVHLDQTAVLYNLWSWGQIFLNVKLFFIFNADGLILFCGMSCNAFKVAKLQQINSTTFTVAFPPFTVDI